MSKKLILISSAVFILAVVLLAIFLSSNKNNGNEISEGTPISERPFAEAIDDTWNRIEFPADGVSLQVPQKWSTYVFNTINQGVVSSYNQTGTTVDFRLNYSDRNHAENIKKYEESTEYSLTHEGEGENRILKYVGLIPMEELTYGMDGGPLSAKDKEEIQNLLENSYVVGKLVPFISGSLIIHCQVYGPEYANFLDDCNKVVEGLIIK